jgi:O-antigen/teichoic acid export membrane protein
MRKHLTNAAYGVLDYASYPFGMLLVAPIVLHKLGASEYGVWMIATSVISAGGIIASGFCDANIQRVARLRGTGDTSVMVHTVRSILGISLVLGSALAIITWIAAPYAARHIAVSHVTSLRECLLSLRIASVLILVRALETVSVSTQRAFEQYRGTVQISTGVRLLTLGTAAVLALAGRGTVSILLGTGFFLIAGTCLQFRQLRRFIGIVPIKPAFQPQETRNLLRSGVFVWIQALGSVILGHFDRILLGVYMGAVAVVPYSLCVQFTQPLLGVAGSGLNFLFPYFSRCASTSSPAAMKRTIWKAFAFNFALVICGAGLLLLFGDRLIRLWAGAAVAKSAAGILPLIILGASLTGISVTGIYAMQAFGLFRTVAFISLAGRGAVLLLMIYLLRHLGIEGLAITRVFYGVSSILIYLPLLRRLEVGQLPAQIAPGMTLAHELQEGSKP